MTSRVSTFSLRLPISLKAAVERMAASDGTSMNQFLVMAAAEKLSAIQTAEAYFFALRGHGDRAAALAFLSRPGGVAPVPGTKSKSGRPRIRNRNSSRRKIGRARLALQHPAHPDQRQRSKPRKAVR